MEIESCKRRPVAPAFAAFDIETVQRFDAAAAQLAATVERRRIQAARAPKTGAPGAIVSAAGVPEPLAAAPPAARHR